MKLTLTEDLVSRNFEARALFLVEAESRTVPNSSQIFGTNMQTQRLVLGWFVLNLTPHCRIHTPVCLLWGTTHKKILPIGRWFSLKSIYSSMRWHFLIISQTISITSTSTYLFFSMSVENRRLENTWKYK